MPLQLRHGSSSSQFTSNPPKMICIFSCSCRRLAVSQIKQHFKSNRDLTRGERNTIAVAKLAICHLSPLTVTFYNLFVLNKDLNLKMFSSSTTGEMFTSSLIQPTLNIFIQMGHLKKNSQSK